MSLFHDFNVNALTAFGGNSDDDLPDRVNRSATAAYDLPYLTTRTYNLQQNDILARNFIDLHFALVVNNAFNNAFK